MSTDGHISAEAFRDALVSASDRGCAEQEELCALDAAGFDVDESTLGAMPQRLAVRSYLLTMKDPAADAVRQWGRLGYPRRALRLHGAARVICERHRGEVPDSVDDLLALPGVGAYTAAAVASFAFGQRHAVLDTNVRRVLARLASGRPWPAPAVTAAEVALAQSLLPARQDLAARWSVAVMELGALVCTASRPGCEACPVAAGCAWHLAGHPVGARPGRQPYEGTDRQCRGRLLAVLRDADGPVPAASLDAVWPDASQRARALASLLADGLADHRPDGGYALPDSR